MFAIAAGITPSVSADTLSIDDYKTIATAEAAAHGLNTAHFLNVIACESKWNNDTIGDRGRSFGLVQIFLPAHPEITQTQAQNPYFSLRWAAEQWSKGKQNMWTCWRTLYGKSAR